MKIHFIAIGGSIMHQLAIALHQKGFVVTGSDDVIFDPAKSNLLKYGLLPANFGWQPNKITSQTDAIILGMHARKNNPELLQAQALNIPIYSFPEYIYEQSKDKKRVVIGGSHGKTTITSMIMHVLRYWQYDFDYLVGAALQGFDSSVKITQDAPIIIIEGDEYLSSPLHRVPKFHYYQPHVALLSGIAWDHINVFPTFDDYLYQFIRFLKTIPSNSTLVYYQADENIRLIVQQAKHLTMQTYDIPAFSVENGRFYLKNKTAANKIIPLQIFGKHNLQNLEGARLVCAELGVTTDQFYEAIQTFKGAARRLELLANDEKKQMVAYKDFAHAPSKVKATTLAVKELYPKRKLIACLELHTYSSLNKAFLPQYAHALDPADEAVVFFNEHTFAIKKLPHLDAKAVQDAFQHSDLQVFTNTPALLQYLQKQSWEKTNLLLMSSGNFGGLDMGVLGF